MTNSWLIFVVYLAVIGHSFGEDDDITSTLTPILESDLVDAQQRSIHISNLSQVNSGGGKETIDITAQETHEHGKKHKRPKKRHPKQPKHSKHSERPKHPKQRPRPPQPPIIKPPDYDHLPCIVPLAEEFPQARCNLMRLNFTADIYTKLEFEEAMRNPHMNMIRFSVALGRVNGKGREVVVVGDQNHREGDLSAEELFRKVVEYNKNRERGDRKGIKIKFPHTKYFLGSHELLHKYYPKLQHLLVVNADIFRGPGGGNKPVDPKEFLGKIRPFERATISLGWTSNQSGRKYTEKDVNEMIKALNTHHIKAPVTFTIRAGPAANSFKAIWKLVDNFDAATLSVWARTNDKIDMTKLNELVATIGPNKIYFTVNEKDKEILRLKGMNF